MEFSMSALISGIIAILVVAILTVVFAVPVYNLIVDAGDETICLTAAVDNRDGNGAVLCPYQLTYIDETTQLGLGADSQSKQLEMYLANAVTECYVRYKDTRFDVLQAPNSCAVCEIITVAFEPADIVVSDSLDAVSNIRVSDATKTELQQMNSLFTIDFSTSLAQSSNSVYAVGQTTFDDLSDIHVHPRLMISFAQKNANDPVVSIHDLDQRTEYPLDGLTKYVTIENLVDGTTCEEIVNAPRI